MDPWSMIGQGMAQGFGAGMAQGEGTPESLFAKLMKRRKANPAVQTVQQNMMQPALPPNPELQYGMNPMQRFGLF